MDYSALQNKTTISAEVILLPVEFVARLTETETELYETLYRTQGDLHALTENYYNMADVLDTKATKDDVFNAIYNNNVCVGVGQELEDRIVSLERSLDSIKALLMELVEKDIVSSWEAVVGDCLS